MPYCFNCGHLIVEDDFFCGSCGTALQQNKFNSESKSTDSRIDKRGYVLTNLDALSQKLSIKSSKLKDILLSFIEEKKKWSVFYTLIDVSNYEPQLSENKGYGKIRLSPSEPWQTHQRLLTDRYVYDVEQQHLDVDYLFIIGGHDIIPMPKVPNYIASEQHNATVDTDMPYGYLYGSQTQPLLESGELFCLQAMLHIGRLPLATDAVPKDLFHYLEQNITVTENGFPKGKAYGQCDPHWKKVSELVMGDLLSDDYNFSGNSNYIYQSLVLSPSVTTTNEQYHPLLDHETLHIDRFFNENAVLYYFNMHGGNFPDGPHFVGEIPPVTKDYLPGISPRSLGNALLSNIVVTEACYGARFIGATVENSMLLSAMRNKTMLYVGSSRVSFGNVDQNGMGISCADIIAKYFTNTFLEGLDAGQAFFISKYYAIHLQPENILSYTTTIEFNLFGDPTLTFYGAENTKATAKTMSQSAKFDQTPQILIRKEDYSKFQIKEINIAASQSILERVRQSVNRNIHDSHQLINEHLYSQYGIQPRKLHRVFEINNQFEKNHLYIYEKDDISQIWVTVDANNQIKRVLTTK